jgi:hypothetical protein
VFCVLIEILGLDNVAVQCRVSRKREIAFIVPLRAHRRPVLVLPPTDILPVRRLPPLRLIPLPLIHSVNFPYSGAHANSRACDESYSSDVSMMEWAPLWSAAPAPRTTRSILRRYSRIRKPVLSLTETA